MSRTPDFDVVIVGGGIAGLMTARTLLKKHPELKVTVLEGKDRVGGRTLTVDIPAPGGKTDRFDLGGQWVGRSQFETLGLVEELGLELYDQYNDGKTLAVLGNREIRPFEDEDYSMLERIDFKLGVFKMDRLTNQIDVTDPLKWKGAAWADQQSVASYADSASLCGAWKDGLKTAVRSNFGTDPKRVSLLFNMVFCKSAEGFMNLVEVTGNGGQAFRIKGGAQQLSELMAAELGERVRLSTEVQAIDTDEDSTTVTLRSGQTLTARRCVLAIPPNQCNRIAFSPPLGYLKKKLFQNSIPGHYIKFIATFQSPFWREDGNNGVIISTGKTNKRGELRPIVATYDGTTPFGTAAIVGFFHVEYHDLTMEERREAALKDLVRFFGPRAESEFVGYAEKNWAEEPLNGGCPVDYMTPGHMDAFVTIRDMHHGVHFAGTETALSWMGYMNGAIESGKRAAMEVLVAFGRTEKIEGKYLVNADSSSRSSHSGDGIRAHL